MAKIWKSHKGPTWALEAYIAFVSIFTCIDHLGLVAVKSNMISNIKLIVTNIQIWKDLGLLGRDWPFVWGKNPGRLRVNASCCDKYL